MLGVLWPHIEGKWTKKEMLQMEVNVVKRQPVYSEEKVYRCLSQPRGHVFIANYANFKGEPDAYRAGSEQDVVNLEYVFKKVRYDF